MGSKINRDWQARQISILILNTYTTSVGSHDPRSKLADLNASLCIGRERICHVSYHMRKAVPLYTTYEHYLRDYYHPLLFLVDLLMPSAVSLTASLTTFVS